MRRVLFFSVLAAACGGGFSNDGDEDAGPDADSDTDSDVDSDADTDADSDTDTGAPCDDPVWQTERIGASEAYFGGPAMAVDAAGDLHVTEDGPRYTTNPGGEWEPKETIDTVGYHTSLALDAEGRAHVSYGTDQLSGGPDGLWYATNDSGAWDSEIVDGTVAAARTAIAVSSDEVHIAYVTYRPDPDLGSVHELRMAIGSPGAWSIETLEDVGRIGADVGLGLDAAGVHHVSYFHRTDCDLKYATDLGGAWELQIIEDFAAGCSDAGVGSALVLDAAGTPHVAYANEAGQIRLAVLEAGYWEIDVVQSGSYSGSAALVLDAEDGPHLAYVTYTAGQKILRYAERSGAFWEEQDVAEDSGPGVALALAAGRPHVVFTSNAPAESDELLHAFSCPE